MMGRISLAPVSSGDPSGAIVQLQLSAFGAGAGGFGGGLLGERSRPELGESCCAEQREPSPPKHAAAIDFHLISS
jgi:hypothetical protein